MARTKQSARKSTGGVAPRKQRAEQLEQQQEQQQQQQQKPQKQVARNSFGLFSNFFGGAQNQENLEYLSDDESEDDDDFDEDYVEPQVFAKSAPVQQKKVVKNKVPVKVQKMKKEKYAKAEEPMRVLPINIQRDIRRGIPLKPTTTHETNFLFMEQDLDGLSNSLLERVDFDSARQAFQSALTNGDAQEWGRCKLMMIGQGRAGKSSTVRTLLGLPFDANLASTVGCDLKVTRTTNWQEHEFQDGEEFQLQSHRAAAARLRKKNEEKKRLEEEAKKCAAKAKQQQSTLSSVKKRISKRLSMIGKSSKKGSKKNEVVPPLPSVETENPQEQQQQQETEVKFPQEEEEIEQVQELYGEEETHDEDEDENNDNEEDSSSHKAQQQAILEQEVVKPFDMALVIKHLHDDKTGSVSFSIWDYGGQEVFYTLHHVFLTRFGIYCVVFDLEQVLEDEEEALRYLHFWLNSIQLHAPSAKFLLVGTHADQVSKPKTHKKIDLILRKKLKLARYGTLIPNTIDGIGFFPLDNSLGGGSKQAMMLRDALELAAWDSDFVHQQVSLRWIKVLDDLLSMKESYLPLERVREECEKYDIDQPQMLTMLSYFHELGCLVHFQDKSEEILRNFVITKPQWLLDKLSSVISDDRVVGHARSAYDEELRDAGLTLDYDRLRDEGMASKELLEFLWQGEPVPYLIEVMKSMILCCPWRFGKTEGEPDDMFLVPSLVPVLQSGEELEEITGPVCHLEFSYLPTGVFERLVCLCAQFSATFSDSGEPILRKDVAVLSFGFSDFRLDRQNDRIRIIVDRESEQVSHVIKLLVSMFRKLKDDIFSKLHWYLTLESSKKKGACVRYETAQDARKAGKKRVRGEKRAIVQVEDLNVFFENEQKDGNLLEDKVPVGHDHHKVKHDMSGKTRSGDAFDCFLSHKQTSGGDAVGTLFHLLSSKGLKCWCDREATSVTKEEMENGIRNSSVYILYLSQGVMQSEYVQFEFSTALKYKKPLLFVHESEPRFKHAYCEFSEYIATAPDFAKPFFESIQSIPYRRYRYEAEAMVDEISRRIRDLTQKQMYET